MSQQPPASLARRVWPAVAVAGASVAFISALDHPTQFVADTVSLTGSQDSGTPTTLVAAVGPVGPVPATTIPLIPVSVPKAPAPSPVVAAAAAPAGGACTGQPITGPVVQTRWGPVQVQAQLTPDRVVCNTVALQTPDSHNRSVQINAYAKPILHRRAVAAGSAQFNAVSGATITSRGYIASLQYILDHA